MCIYIYIYIYMSREHYQKDTIKSWCKIKAINTPQPASSR